MSISKSVSKTSVSSVLNRDVKQYGKKYLFDGDEETCWNSDQGSPQWISVEFDKLCTVREIQIKFQGGFAGRECFIEGSTDGTFTKIVDFFPDDVNSLQTFKLDNPQTVKQLKITFNNSCDFFGRITVYNLDIIGDVLT